MHRYSYLQTHARSLTDENVLFDHWATFICIRPLRQLICLEQKRSRLERNILTLSYRK